MSFRRSNSLSASSFKKRSVLDAAGYEPLDEPPVRVLFGEMDVPSARVSFTEPPAYVSLQTRGQHSLHWAEPLHWNDTLLEPGSLNLYTYPGGYSGDELELIRLVMLEVARVTPSAFERADAVGAKCIHALLVCNTEASFKLVLDILAITPCLLLQTHVGEPFRGEGCLHIVAANRREELGCALIDIAVEHFSSEQVGAPVSYFLLPGYCLLPTSYFLLPTSYFLLPTSYFLLLLAS